MPFDLTSKNVLVTGASSGLGRAIAAACADAGARVVLLGRDRSRLEQALGECPGDGHVLWQADLTELDGLPAVVRTICGQVGPLSGLVHSAGRHQPVPIRAMSRKHMDALLTVNAEAAVMLAKGLSARGNYAPDGASVVLISSVLGRVGQPGTIGYCMSKGALEQAARAMALELMAQKIRVNCVAPAVVRTAMSEEFLATIGQEQARRILEQHPGGFASLQDVTGAVIYLLCDASRYVTGTSLAVDGGYTAQ